MASVIRSPEDAVNESLRAIGYKYAIGDFYEGSPQSRAALEIYSQTLDEVLRAEDWPFANGDTVLTLQKGPPPTGGYYPGNPWGSLYPQPGWRYQYAYPDDCIELSCLVPPPTVWPILDPKPAVYQVSNDLTPVISGGVAVGPPQRVILANLPNAIAIYRRRVTNLQLWEPGALASLIAAVAKKLASNPRLAASADMMKQTSAEAAATIEIADHHRG